MSTAYEIPLKASAQNFTIAFPNATYEVTVKWNVFANCWVIDFLDNNGNEVLTGVPLVTGVDLLAQFPDLNFGGQLIVQTDHDTDAVPTFDNLGDTGHVYLVV